ncbi:MAG: energy transducer TonB [Gammaproteobacteria bacterium]
MVHATVILGVSFSPPSQKPLDRPLDVILVHQKSPEQPKEAEVLAQAAHKGGGDSAENVRPATPFTAPFPEQRADIAAAPPPGRPSRLDTVVTPTPPSREPPSAAQGIDRSPRPDRLTAATKKAPAAKARPAEESEPVIVKAPTPDAEALINRSLAMASLNAEIAQRLEARAKRPRRKFISATTHEHKYAAYMEAWRVKVERIGNLNYPEVARRHNLTGSLILDVALKPDGSITDIAVRRPSGYKLLDEAAIQIVKLSSPFAPFPHDIEAECDILHITRTWQFLTNYRLTSN